MYEALAQVNKLWLDKLRLAEKRKLDDFDAYADQIWGLYHGPKGRLSVDGDGVVTGWGLPEDCPSINVNKPFQLRAVFLPYMHHKNPVRTSFDDRKPVIAPDLILQRLGPQFIQDAEMRYYESVTGVSRTMPGFPQGVMQAVQTGMIQPFDPYSLVVNPQDEANKEIGKLLLGGYLNYTPNELNLKGESYEALTDGLLPGRGVLWTEALPTVRGPMIGSFHVPIRDFFVDPDHCKPREWQYVFRKKRMPKWQVSEMTGIPVDRLKADGITSQGTASANVRYGSAEDEHLTRSQDLITYYEVWSRCGIGHHLVTRNDELDALGAKAGQCVKLLISEAFEYPLNMNPDLMQVDDPALAEQAMQQILADIQWPLAYYRDPAWPWPFAILDFHTMTGSPWPYAHMRGVLDKMLMLNWIYSHVAESVRMSSGGRWLLNSQLDPDVKERLKSGLRELWVELNLKPEQRMQDQAHFIQAPELNKDLWQVAVMMEKSIEDETGMTPLLLGGAPDHQWRSSAEAQIKERASESRPASMADTYDDFQSRAARNEAIAARSLLGPESISVWLGEQQVEQPADAMGQPQEPLPGMMTQMWMETVYNPDVDAVMAETDYRIESGSMRKPNFTEMQSALTEMAQNFFPYFQQQAAMGDSRNMQTIMDAYSKAGHMPQFFADMPAPPPMPQQGQPQQ